MHKSLKVSGIAIAVALLTALPAAAVSINLGGGSNGGAAATVDTNLLNDGSTDANARINLENGDVGSDPTANVELFGPGDQSTTANVTLGSGSDGSNGNVLLDLFGVGAGSGGNTDAQVAIGTGEREWTVSSYKRLIETGIVDVVGIDPARAEGLTGFRMVDEICGAHGLTINAHAWSTAILTAASLQASFASPNTRLLELKPIPNIALVDLVKTPITHCEGVIRRPPGPGLGIEVDEAAIPVNEVVRGACEMLGLDPLLVANEGKLVAFVPEEGAEQVLEAMRRHPLGREAARIGRVCAEHPGMVIRKTRVGGQSLLDLPFGEALPRIC